MAERAACNHVCLHAIFRNCFVKTAQLINYFPFLAAIVVRLIGLLNNRYTCQVQIRPGDENETMVAQASDSLAAGSRR